MSDPIYGSSPSFVPPSSSQGQRRSGPGCWVWGLLSCLVVVLIVAVLIGVSFYRLSTSPSGRKLFGSMGTVIADSKKLGPSISDMKAVHDAIVRYHERNGEYPEDLAALSPDYISSPSLLHAPIDPNPDPSHISFIYKRPAAGAPQSTPVLTLVWSYTIDAGVQKQTMQTQEIMLLNGRIETSSNQTISTPSSTTSGGTVKTKTVIHTDGNGKVSTSAASDSGL